MRYAVIATYEGDLDEQLDERIRGLTDEQCDSGYGFGQRDFIWDFEDKAKAEALREVIQGAALAGVEVTVDEIDDDDPKSWQE